MNAVQDTYSMLPHGLSRMRFMAETSEPSALDRGMRGVPHRHVIERIKQGDRSLTASGTPPAEVQRLGTRHACAAPHRHGFVLSGRGRPGNLRLCRLGVKEGLDQAFTDTAGAGGPAHGQSGAAVCRAGGRRRSRSPRNRSATQNTAAPQSADGNTVTVCYEEPDLGEKVFTAAGDADPIAAAVNSEYATIYHEVGPMTITI